MNNKLIPQSGYSVVNVKDEMPNKDAICFKGKQQCLFHWHHPKDINDFKITHWLKEYSGKYVLDAAELEQIIDRYTVEVVNNISTKTERHYAGSLGNTNGELYDTVDVIDKESIYDIKKAFVNELLK